MTSGRSTDRRRRTVRATVAGCLLVLGVSSTLTPAEAEPTPVTSPADAPTWAACADDAAYQCTTVTVPLDYDAPTGAQISVAAIRHLATDPRQRIGSLFWNPGGPGGAGTDSLPMFWSSFPATLRARYDIVSFDPRGIGRSTPLTCFADPADEAQLLGQLPAGFPVGAAEQRRQIAVQAQFDQACANHGGPIQFHMGTANVARDMDRLRAAVGAPRLDYWGTSYGTNLGATYANLFPQRAGHIVLDGNVPPQQWNDASGGATDNTFTRLASPLGTQTGLSTMLEQCGEVNTGRCGFGAGTAAATVSKYRVLLQRLQAAPVTVQQVPFTYASTIAQVAALLVAQNDNPVTHTGWALLGDLLQVLWRQSAPGAPPAVSVPADVAELLQRAPADSVARPEGTPGVLCSESPNPTAPSSYAAQAERANALQSPDGFGPLWTWLAEPCAQWQARDADRYTGPWNAAAGPFLVVGTVADSNTAFVGSQLMAAQLRNTRLLTETGGGHTALLNRSTCVDRRVVAFFLTGALPPVGLVCAQDRAPF